MLGFIYTITQCYKVDIEIFLHLVFIMWQVADEEIQIRGWMPAVIW